MRLENMLMYPLGSTPACRWAAKRLAQAGIAMVDHPSPEVTHLLLDVPSFSADGKLRGGGELKPLLRMLPDTITVIGGNLAHPELKDYPVLDLLKDGIYVANNAAITADCALRVAAPKLQTTFAETPALIIGWGRIGKCLAKLLQAMGTEVTVAARKESDRAMLEALGYRTLDIPEIPQVLEQFGVIYNTVPQKMLTQDQLSPYSKSLKIDLASQPGLEGEDVVIARGLPGLYAPESSGRLIAKTILRLTGR